MKKIIWFFPWLLGALFIFPIVAGFIGTVFFSVGYLPGVSEAINWQGWQLLFEFPSLYQSTILTIVIGFSATALSVVGAIIGCIYIPSLPLFRKSLPLFLSFPHIAIAMGMIFLFSPTGWLVRAFNFFLFEITEPLGVNLVNDVHGFSLIVALMIKETPFLITMGLLILNQLNSEKQLHTIRSLGYVRETGFSKFIVPQLLPKLRLPIFAILVYSLSTIELSIIIGPNIPKPLILLLHYWFLDADSSYQYAANAGAIYLLFISLLCILLWIVVEKIVIRMCLWSGLRARRYSWLAYLKPFIKGYFYLLLMVIVLSIMILFIWAFARGWFFPEFLPNTYTLKSIVKYSIRLFPALLNTLFIGGVSTLVGLILVIGALEHESTKENYQRTSHYFHNPKWLWVIYLPLIIPAISFMFGVYLLFLYLDLNNTWLGLFWVHLLFIVPYLFLTLSSNYLSFDARYSVQALLLCRSYWKSLYKVKFPLLMRTIAFAFAVGFSVSVAQYITTLYIGGGRIDTVTTENIASLSGSNRRVLATYTLYQWLLPLLFFLCAAIVPSYKRNGSDYNQ